MGNPKIGSTTKLLAAVERLETAVMCGEVDARTKSARNANKTQGLMSHEVSKRCDESNVSVPKTNARRGLNDTIVVD